MRKPVFLRWFSVGTLLLILGGVLRASNDGNLPRNRPNILLVVSDDLRVMTPGRHGIPVRTPHIDRIAREGVTFERTFCQYPVCGPSRASFMSGLYPEQLRMMGNSYVEGSYRSTNPQLKDHPSVGGLLRRNGYVSIRVSKIFHMGVPFSLESGDPAGDDADSWDRAFNIMAPETISEGPLTLLSPKRRDFGTAFVKIVIPDIRVDTQADYLAASQAIAVLEARSQPRPSNDRRVLRTDQPFFLAVGLVRPHVPLIAPRRIFERYRAAETVVPVADPEALAGIPKPARAMANAERYGMDEQQKREAIVAYYAAVEFMDEQVGRLLGALDRLKLRSNTVVVFISDHGFHLGEHDLWQKTTLFDESTRVPLIIASPSNPAGHGKVNRSLVELVDLYPTLAAMAGIADRIPSGLPGRNLQPLLDKPESDSGREFAYMVTGNDGRSIRTSRWRYNYWGEAGEELYDLVNDPEENHNLSSDPKSHDTLTQMRLLLSQKKIALSEPVGVVAPVR